MCDFAVLFPISADVLTCYLQEYNICFTTVDRKPLGQSTPEGELPLPELPDPTLPAGVLPTQVRLLRQGHDQE
jgi:hypothetical protein